MLGVRALGLLVVPVLGVAALGQETRASEDPPGYVTAVFDLARFAEWPDEASQSATFRLCLRDDDPALGGFRGFLGRSVGGRQVSLHTLTPGAMDRRPCHLIFFSEGYVDRASLAALEGRPVLTVSPQAGFASMGGAFELRPAGQTPRFSVSAAVIQDHPVKISSQLLGMAELLP